jgi:ribonucleoside-diphosphate reductase alpha chain
VSENAEDRYEGPVGPDRIRMPRDRSGMTVKVEITSPIDGQTTEGYITANANPDGSLGEIFLTGFGKAGSTLEGWVQFAAMLFSIALQYGAEFPMLARKISVTKFEPYGSTNHPDIPWCNSVPDFIVRWLALRFGDDMLNDDLHEGAWAHEALSVGP